MKKNTVFTTNLIRIKIIIIIPSGQTVYIGNRHKLIEFSKLYRMLSIIYGKYLQNVLFCISI